MATTQAIAAVLETVLFILESKAQPKGFGGSLLKFKVIQPRDFDVPPPAGVTLYLYSVTPNPALANRPAGRVNPDGSRQPPSLMLDLHFLLTAWARDARLQQEITGWMMRQVDSTPVLSATLLSQRFPGVFQPEETVELLWEPLPAEQVIGIWKAASTKGYQVSIPYLARRIGLDG